VDTDALEYARIDDLSFDAAPGRGTTGESEPADARDASSSAHAGAPAAEDHGPWPWISLALAAGWALTLLLWWRRGRAAPSPAAASSPSLQSAGRAVRKAAGRGDPGAAAEALLAWGAALWPSAPPRSLRALAERCDDGLAAAIATLERHLYAADGGPWDGRALAAAVARFRPPRPSSSPRPGGLAPLYPE
jgi:hypothetical protein